MPSKQTRLRNQDTRRARHDRTTPGDASIDDARRIADALCRAADACYQQHSRSARLAEQDPVAQEERGVERLCAVCDETLAELATAYERAAAHMRPGQSDQEWWHRANALWLASQEYARRQRSCDGQTRQTSRPAARHTASELEALHIEFEFEASALLALRQACDDYRRSRPQAL